ncbi:hypothetical protein B0H11DRAFT_542114 [Mycena galericulata]|nr:hypothetical protein B0H11DRAFT_542114 [Mycena galericulata]
MAHRHQFMRCPDGCGASIPCVLVFRGKNVPWHAGLRYQVCRCGCFVWLDPDLFNAAERRQADSPANGAPPFPPPDYPDDPWAASPTLPTYTPNIDPVLQQTPYTSIAYPISSPISDSPASCSVTISQTKMRIAYLRASRRVAAVHPRYVQDLLRTATERLSLHRPSQGSRTCSSQSRCCTW